jgi:hypothetical protein
MKQVILKRLTLSNFKGIHSLDAKFGPERTTISGHNGTGKSTVADAYNWLLFGKNAAGETDQRFTIKTVDAAGDTVPDLAHEVEGLFAVIDTETGEMEDILLRRAYVEEWKKGETPDAPRILRGHHTDYFYNNVIVKMADYNANVAAMIDPAIFKFISDPAAFFALPWEEQRRRLTDVTGEVSPEEIAAQDPEYAAMLARLKGVTLEQYRATLAANRKRVDDELQKIPTRIDEVSRATPEAPDYAALEAEKAELESRADAIDAANRSIAEANRQHYERINALQEQLSRHRTAQREIADKLKEETYREYNAVNRARFAHQAELEKLEHRLEANDRDLEMKRDNTRRAVERLTEQSKQLEAKREELRTQFKTVSTTAYDPARLVCPRFGHVCQDPEACGKGEEAYNTSRVETLTRMRDEGHRIADDIEKVGADMKRRLDELTQAIESNTAARNELTQAIADEKQKIAELTPREQPEEADARDTPEWQQEQQAIEELEAQLKEEVKGDATGGTSAADKREITRRLDDVKKQLNLRETIAKSHARIAQLEEQARDLARQKADLEKELATADNFTIDMMTAVEERVNAHFETVRFKMFKTLVNGSRQPDCFATINGVRYADANTAAKINAGLDVIRAFSSYYAIQAPVFVDNCESVARLKHTEGRQLVRLQFIADKPLTVDAE